MLTDRYRSSGKGRCSIRSPSAHQTAALRTELSHPRTETGSHHDQTLVTAASGSRMGLAARVALSSRYGPWDSGPPTADTQRGAPSIEVSEQSGRELPPAHPGAITRDETLSPHPATRSGFCPRSAAYHPHVRPRRHRLTAAEYRARDEHTPHHLEPGHRTGPGSRLTTATPSDPSCPGHPSSTNNLTVPVSRLPRLSRSPTYLSGVARPPSCRLPGWARGRQGAVARARKVQEMACMVFVTDGESAVAEQSGNNLCWQSLLGLTHSVTFELLHATDHPRHQASSGTHRAWAK